MIILFLLFESFFFNFVKIYIFKIHNLQQHYLVPIVNNNSFPCMFLENY